MPCRPSPKSLRLLGLEAVAVNLERFCYGVAKGSKELMDIIESDRYQKYTSPFSNWPSTLLEDLSCVVYNKRAGLKHLLYPIIQPQITHYTIMLHGSIHVAMDLVSKRCKDLVQLSLTYSINLPPMYYPEFFKHFPKLTYLNLYGSMVDDSSFKIIGENCPNLVELNAAKTWITDVGLFQMSIGADEDNFPLQKLALFHIQETKTTPDGLSIFLQRHPNIIRIEHPETFHMFRAWGRGRPCRVTKLAATKLSLSSEQWNTAIESCPEVDTVLVTSPGLQNEDLYQLMTLNKLKDIHISNPCHEILNFYEGLAPVLDAVGQNLNRLVLENLTEIDINFIGEKCPNLKHFAVSSITSYSPVLTINPAHFKSLTNLEVWNKNGIQVCPNVIRQLMTNASLRNIIFQCIDSLNDLILQHIWEQNPMLSLKNVVFDQCHEITARTLWRLLEIPNRLRILRCWNCKQVSLEDKEAIKAAIQDSNLSVYWEWYPYVEQTPIAHQLEEYEVQA